MASELFMYVGTYTESIKFGTGDIFEGKGKGIYSFRVDLATGKLEQIGCTEGVINPSYLAIHPSGTSLYAVNEMKEYEGAASGSVSSFALDRSSGKLMLLNKQPSYGTDPCHILVDGSGKNVIVANFASGSFSSYPILPDGSLAEAATTIQHQGTSIDQNRQTGPHAHSVLLDENNRFAYVADLGMDRIMIYKWKADRCKFTPASQPWFPVKPGAGPRHFALHPTGKYLYLINELDSTIAGYERDRTTGALHEIQIVTTLPTDFPGQNSCADLHLTPDGNFLYGSNRGHNSLVIYRVDPKTGLLRFIGHESTGGKTPRNFAIEPSGNYLYAANQDSGTIVHFTIDRNEGTLQATGDVTEVPTPVCIQFL